MGTGSTENFVASDDVVLEESPKPLETVKEAIDRSGHELFIDTFNAVAKEIHETAKEKGWWDKERNDGEILMLMVTELAECCEGLRTGNPPDDKVPQFSAAEAELADCIIRIMDMAPARGWRVAEALIAKIEFNKTRPKMHGGKSF